MDLSFLLTVRYSPLIRPVALKPLSLITFPMAPITSVPLPLTAAPLTTVPI